jgi:hypothetical protein
MAGTSAPQHVYSLATSQTAPSPSLSKTVALSPRFYLGGNIYTDWANVPNKFKIADPNAPDPNRSTASLFKFVW